MYLIPDLKGQRIELVSMPEDPCPIEIGSQGIVTRVQDLGRLYGGVTMYQLTVDWDESVGRSLCIVIPPDVIRVVDDEQFVDVA